MSAVLMLACFGIACSGPDRESLWLPASSGNGAGNGSGGGSSSGVPRETGSYRPPTPGQSGPDSAGVIGQGTPVTTAGDGPSITPAPGETTDGEPPQDEATADEPPPVDVSPTPMPSVGDEEAPIGWASVTADGQAGTVGGRGGDVVLVATADALRAALQGAEPRIVRVTDSFVAGAVAAGSNKTLEGAPGVALTLSLRINGQRNVIVRDLTLLGFGCAAGNLACGDGSDVVEISNSHHVWVHHVSIADGTDGNLDVVAGSSYVTVSWSKFFYQSADHAHRLSNVVGAGDDVAADVGRLDVTWHNNWWADNVDQGMPRTRRGNIHVFNNLYTAAGNLYCTNAGFEASVLVENNVYIGVNRPLAVDVNGDMLARGNLFVASAPPEVADGAGFVPPYPYTLSEAAQLEQLVRAGAGPRGR